MPRTYRKAAVTWERHMAHESCGKCLRAARMAKTDTIVDDVDEATRTIVGAGGEPHTATVVRRERPNL